MRLRRVQQHGEVKQAGKVMRVRIAHVDGKGISPAFLQDGQQPTFHLGKSVIPAHLQPLITPAHYRLANTIPVRVQFLETIGFRANISMAKNVLLIPSDGEHLAPARHDLQSAGRFTKWTCRVACLCIRHWSASPLPADLELK